MSTVAFLGPPNASKLLAAGTLPQTPLREFTALPRTPAGFKGPTSNAPTLKGKEEGRERQNYLCPGRQKPSRRHWRRMGWVWEMGGVGAYIKGHRTLICTYIPMIWVRQTVFHVTLGGAEVWEGRHNLIRTTAVFRCFKFQKCANLHSFFAAPCSWWRVVFDDWALTACTAEHCQTYYCN